MASNGTTRLRRLVKNMVVQLGAVQTPSAVPFYYDERQTEEHEGGSDNEDGDEMSTSVTQNGGASTNPKSGNKSNREESMQAPVFGPGVPMFRLGKAIAMALRVLVAVDTAVSTNADLQEAWAMYKDVVMEWSEEKRTVSVSTYQNYFPNQIFCAWPNSSIMNNTGACVFCIGQHP